jgi:L-lactate dehydrogenase complex protein LldG
MTDDVLARVRAALAGRERLPHPGASPSTAAVTPDSAGVVQRFAASFTAAGGEVVRLPEVPQARRWAAAFAAELAGVAQSSLVPPALRVEAPAAPPERAALGISVALHAVAETGSLVLSSAEGRRLQLLPPTHLVWVPVDSVRDTLAEALGPVPPSGVSALALHSGPSKSADIGRIVVTGVHGPARVIAAVVG